MLWFCEPQHDVLKKSLNEYKQEYGLIEHLKMYNNTLRSIYQTQREGSGLTENGEKPRIEMEWNDLVYNIFHHK